MADEKTALDNRLVARLESYATALSGRIENERLTETEESLRGSIGAMNRRIGYETARDLFYTAFPEVAKTDE